MSEQQTTEAAATPQATPAAPLQASLDLAPTAATPQAPKSEIGAKDLAKLMSENETMRARLAEFESTQSAEATEKAQAEKNALLEAHAAQLSEAKAAADAALASARRNAIKAYFRGSLKSDSYLALVPEVAFDASGDLTAESIESLDGFRSGHAELFNTTTTATTAMSASGASNSAEAYSEQDLAVMRLNKIATPGSDRHWSKRANADVLSDFVGFAKIGGQS